MKLNIDWDGCNYSSINGFHPLFRFLLGKTSAEPEVLPQFVVHTYREKLATYQRLSQPDFKAQLAGIRAAGASTPAFGWTWEFFDIEEQFLTELHTEDAYFCHTFPLSLGIRHFVFHMEDVKLLFLPFSSKFGIDVAAANHCPEFEVYRRYIGTILASDRCMAIYCHYRETAAALLDAFRGYDLESKIQMLNLVSLHGEYRGPTRARGLATKKRLLFTHSYHGNVDSIRARGLDAFLDLCRELAVSELGGRVLPTLLLPNEYKDETPKDISLEVFHGYVPEDIYESILVETQFHFLASPWVHTKVVVDCIAHGIVPIFRRHAAYCELGFSDHNSINLGCPRYNPLTFYDRSELELRPDPDAVISSMKRFMGHIQTDASACLQTGGISNLEDFRRGLEDRLSGLPRGGERKHAGVIQRLAHEHFTMSARFLVHAQFNGFDILTDRVRYVYRRTGGATTFSLSELKSGTNYFNSLKGIVIFENLVEVRAALEWCSAQKVSRRATLFYRMKHRLSRHKRLYQTTRGIYRWMKRLRKVFTRQF